MDNQNSNWPTTGIDDLPDDRRNIIDHYKYWKIEAIRAELDTKRLPYALLLENYAYDFNLATTVRNANAFLAGAIHVCGRRKWDKRGDVGTRHYENISYHDASRTVIEDYQQKGYQIVAIDNIEGAVSMNTYSWPEKSLIIFGQESIGISPDALKAADDVVYIPQLGSVRSLNVGVASGIAMFSYASQHTV
jgi:tRNA G18 (ribose-2'-O)-methylase SpoU